MSSIYVARQPIFELNRGLYGYELLYRRDATSDHAEGETGAMSAEVIVDALLGIGLRAIAGGTIAFVNFSQAQLIGETWSLFDPADVVIELLETVQATEETLASCRKMVAAGYRLALDDYVHSEATRPLLEFAKIVKIDVLGRSEAEIASSRASSSRRAFACSPSVSRPRRCATPARRSGFEFFQGYLFSKPETHQVDVAPGQLAIMRLLNLLTIRIRPTNRSTRRFRATSR